VKVDALLSELEQVAKGLSIRVSYEPLGGELGAGGLCKVKGEWRVIVDKRATPAERLSVLAQSMARFPVMEQQLSPELRELLQRTQGLRAKSGGP